MSKPTASPTAALFALVGVVVAVIAALVLLEVLGLDESVLLGFVAAPVALLIVLVRGEQTANTQNAKLDEISRQTNGELDARIRAQIRAALDENPVTGPPR